MEEQNKKITIPPPAQEAILALYDDLVRARDAAEQAQKEASRAQITANISRQSFAEFIAMSKRELNVPRDWDLTPIADAFYEPLPNQEPLLPAQMQAVEAPVLPEENEEEQTNASA